MQGLPLCCRLDCSSLHPLVPSWIPGRLHLRDRLICCHILVEICDHVSGGLKVIGRERGTGGVRRPYPSSMIDVVGVKASLSDLIYAEVSGELIYDCADHLKMGKLFSSQRSSGNVPLSQSNESSDFTGFLVYSLKTSDKVVRYGENNQVEFSEHPTVVQRGNERTINLLVSTPDVA